MKPPFFGQKECGMPVKKGQRGMVMKKKWWKKTLCAALALGMAMGFGGCGSRDKNENAGLAKEHVYKFEEFEFPEIDGDSYYVQGILHQNGKITMIMNVNHWESNDGSVDYRLITMNEDGSDVAMVRLETPNYSSKGQNAAVDPGFLVEPGGEAGEPEGEPEEPEGEPEESEEETEEDEPIDEGDRDIADEKYPDDSGNIWENTNYYNFVLGSDGKVYGIKNYNYQDYSDPEEYVSIRKRFVCSWNGDGSMQWEADLGEMETEDEYININTMFVDANGVLNLIMMGNDIYRMTVDASGNPSERTKASDTAYSIFNNLNRAFSRADGTLLVTYSDENDWSKQFLASYDPATDTLGEPTALPANLMWNYNTIETGSAADLVYTNSTGVFFFNRGNTEAVEKMNFINSDLNNPYFSSLIDLGEDKFFGAFTENYDEDLKVGVFTYVKPEDIPDKEVMVLAGEYVNSDIKKRVVEFNRSSDQYRIVVKEYEYLNGYDDWQAGYTQLNNDITTGHMPDILLTNGLPVDNYATKGLLADIGKMIEEDEELSSVEFMENVFNAFSMDGKLLYVVPSFYISTMVAKTSLVGDRTGWSMKDMRELMATLPEGTSAMGEILQGDFFNVMMGYCGRDFIDVDSGKCEFDSQNFIDMMEYAKTLPKEMGDDTYDDGWWENYQSQYRENRTLLCQMNISSMRNLPYTINGRVGEDVSYIGFPTETGKGSYISANMQFALSARSSHLDGAWSFVRYYLTDEYQSELTYGLPIQKKYLTEVSKEATQRPYYLDENGNKQEYDDTYYMNGEEIIIKPLDQVQLDKAMDFIETVDNSYYWNEDIMNIINEEMDGFFTGQKSAQDVAKIIQSRAQIYVDENR